ncbi:DUF2206 domain-containing protein [Methanofollis formosanus]|uniref:DUF2206 domain-containing protein n=1 Tax=Methanofollis formosanus TaxID=299308 RepID=A0A8G1EFS9_9EURY|nr:DUF2206 domain-containing protein [Methanofollis formosanus]QYZ78449.1 DUF2206 domain-containing protein [Methanofollis formosanus]
MDITNHISFPLVLAFTVIMADISIVLDIPIYRQVFGFFLVTFVPGLLIFHILDLKFKCPSKTVLYSVGFSVAIAMFLGFFVNLIGPLFGLNRPISITPLLVSINVVVIILFIISFVVSPAGYKSPIDLSGSFVLLFSPQGSFLLLILLLGIIGGFAVRYYIWSIFSVTAMFLISVTVSLIAFDKFFKKRHYALTLFIIGLTLLLNRTLTSPYVGGTDIHVELFFQKLTEVNAYWDPSIYPYTCNTMLSTVILPTVYSVLLGINTIFVYKVIFSIFFALVPVALYHLFRTQIKPKFSFFSVCLFMSFYAFFLVLTWLPRQQVAELYLVLLLLTLFLPQRRCQSLLDSRLQGITSWAENRSCGGSVQKESHEGVSTLFNWRRCHPLLIFTQRQSSLGEDISLKILEKYAPIQRRIQVLDTLGIVSIIWMSSIVVSHYSLAYMSLFFIIVVSIIVFISNRKINRIKLLVIVFAVIMTFSWYVYISLSKTLEASVSIVQGIIQGIENELFSPSAIDPNVDKALGIGLFDLPFWHAIGHIWQLGTQILILLGFVYVLSGYVRKRSRPELTLFQIVGMIILFMSMTLPFFASSLNLDRIYHIILIFISPLCVIGLVYLIEWISRHFNIQSLNKQKIISVCLVLVFVPYFLFNSGAIFEVTERSNNLVLEIDQSIDHSQYFSNSTYYFLNQRVPSEDVAACEWISTFRITGSPVYSDVQRECELWGYGLIPLSDVFGRLYPPTTGGYVFVGRQNVIENRYICLDRDRVRSSVIYGFDQIQSDLKPRNLVYSSGAVVYK